MAERAGARTQGVPRRQHSASLEGVARGAASRRGFPAKGGEVRTGIRMRAGNDHHARDNVLDAFQVDGKDRRAVGAWLDSKLRILASSRRAISSRRTSFPRIRSGAAPRARQARRELGELARWFGGAADVLEEFRAKLPGLRAEPRAVLAAPFDIATLSASRRALRRTRALIGVGASPGDEYYAQPYFYINPWPRFDAKAARSARARALAHEASSRGADGDEILAMKDRGGRD